MNVIQINVVGFQAAQTRLDALHDVVTRRTAVIHTFAHFGTHFGGDDNAVPQTRERVAEQRFRHAGRIAVNIRRVEKINAFIERAMHDLFCAVQIHRAPDAIASDADHRNLHA